MRLKHTLVERKKSLRMRTERIVFKTSDKSCYNGVQHSAGRFTDFGKLILLMVAPSVLGSRQFTALTGSKNDARFHKSGQN